MTKPRGYFVEYRSALNGEKCIAVFTSFARSKNTKTGDMIQVWFLPRSWLPSVNFREENDQERAVCGNCPIKTRCYARKGRTMLAANSIWKAYNTGSYVRLDLTNETHLDHLRSKPIRFGALGDPASLPTWYWEMFFTIVHPDSWTGYTHHWRQRHLQRWYMASIESIQDTVKAENYGYRYFRIIQGVKILYMKPSEHHCPASKEQGHKGQCADCLICCGNHRRNSPNVVILEH